MDLFGDTAHRLAESVRPPRGTRAVVHETCWLAGMGPSPSGGDAVASRARRSRGCYRPAASTRQGDQKRAVKVAEIGLDAIPRSVGAARQDSLGDLAADRGRLVDVAAAVVGAPGAPELSLDRPNLDPASCSRPRGEKAWSRRRPPSMKPSMSPRSAERVIRIVASATSASSSAATAWRRARPRSVRARGVARATAASAPDPRRDPAGFALPGLRSPRFSAWASTCRDPAGGSGCGGRWLRAGMFRRAAGAPAQCRIRACGEAPAGGLSALGGGFVTGRRDEGSYAGARSEVDFGPLDALTSPSIAEHFNFHCGNR